MKFEKNEIVKITSKHLKYASETAKVLMMNDLGEISAIQFDSPVGFKTEIGLAISNVIPVLFKNKNLYEDLWGNLITIEKVR